MFNQHRYKNLLTFYVPIFINTNEEYIDMQYKFEQLNTIEKERKLTEEEIKLIRLIGTLLSEYELRDKDSLVNKDYY